MFCSTTPSRNNATRIGSIAESRCRYATAVRPIQFLRGRACVRSKPFTSIASSSGRMVMLHAPLAAGHPKRPRSNRL